MPTESGAEAVVRRSTYVNFEGTTVLGALRRALHRVKTSHEPSEISDQVLVEEFELTPI